MGHLKKKHEIKNGYTLFETVYPPELKQPRHMHEPASFSFVLAGGYIEDYGRRAHARQPSTVIFHPPQESHAVDFQSAATRILSVRIAARRLAYLREHSIVLDSSTSCRNEKIARLGRQIHREFRRADAFSGLAIEGLIFEILAESFRAQSLTTERKSPYWLKQVLEFLHDNFSQSFTNEDVGKIARVHPVHLALVFRQRNGCTIGEYVRRLRLEYARRQLSATEFPLSEIALAVGFADHSHFTRAFKAHFGFTPSEYRRKSRKTLD